MGRPRRSTPSQAGRLRQGGQASGQRCEAQGPSAASARTRIVGPTPLPRRPSLIPAAPLLGVSMHGRSLPPLFKERQVGAPGWGLRRWDPPSQDRRAFIRSRPARETFPGPALLTASSWLTDAQTTSSLGPHMGERATGSSLGSLHSRTLIPLGATSRLHLTLVSSRVPTSYCFRRPPGSWARSPSSVLPPLTSASGLPPPPSASCLPLGTL